MKKDAGFNEEISRTAEYSTDLIKALSEAENGHEIAVETTQSTESKFLSEYHFEISSEEIDSMYNFVFQPEN
jgi:hypothetical protein